MTQIEKAHDLKETLIGIIDFMQHAGVSYDNAANGEARRLAVCILTLAEDTKATPSLLSMMGLKEIPILDSSPDYNEKLDLPLCGLAIVTLGAKTMSYIPRFDKNPNIKNLSFDLWWNKPVIINKNENVSMTRRDIVYAVAASNVGTTNPRLHTAFEEISRSVPFGQVTSGSLNADMVLPLFASVRQISYELLGSLYDHVPQYFKSRE